MGERELWDARYHGPELIHGHQPSEFLSANAGLLPRSGLALDIAAGEGRNAVFIAERGLEVIALDISVPALQKCMRIATERKLKVESAAIDLAGFDIPRCHFDVIANFNYLQRGLAQLMIEGLRPGGILIFETLTTAHLRWKPEFNPAFLLEPGELTGLFHGLHLIKYRETDLQGATGPRAVASIIARRDPLS